MPHRPCRPCRPCRSAQATLGTGDTRRLPTLLGPDVGRRRRPSHLTPPRPANGRLSTFRRAPRGRRRADRRGRPRRAGRRRGVRWTTMRGPRATSSRGDRPPSTPQAPGVEARKATRRGNTLTCRPKCSGSWRSGRWPLSGHGSHFASGSRCDVAHDSPAGTVPSARPSAPKAGASMAASGGSIAGRRTRVSLSVRAAVLAPSARPPTANGARSFSGPQTCTRSRAAARSGGRPSIAHDRKPAVTCRGTPPRRLRRCATKPSLDLPMAGRWTLPISVPAIRERP